MSRSSRTSRRAIGIVRVSQVRGGDGESFASPVEQRERIEVACARDGLKLLRVEEELDVSGGTPLERRSGLRSAVEAVEAGEVDVIVGAYFDRLVRSLRVQAEVVSRVEQAGGSVLALDVGEVTEGTAGSWLSGTMLGAVAEYHRRATGERAGEAQRRAVERGVAPFPVTTHGYRRGEDGVLVVEPREAKIVAEAFRLRAEGSTIREVQGYLAEHGIERTWYATQVLLKSRIVLGEIRFGELVNEHAHPPIVDADLWRRAQRTEIRGPRPKSDQLLARLGVLRCASCGARMVAGSQRQGKKRYPLYRCPPTGECTRRMVIGANIVENAVIEHVKLALADVEGRASAQTNIETAQRTLAQAQDALDGAIRTLADFTDEPAARERLAELRAARDGAQEQLDKLGGAPVDVTVNAARDWDLLTPDGRRALIAAVVETVTVAPGRGPERIEIQDVAA
jgi:DNA invertase Pin-like site-specific DNA recombinase